MTDNYSLDTTKLDEIISDTPGRIDTFLSDVADQIVSEIQESFGDAPGSSPGDPPGTVTGSLKESVEAVKDEDGYIVLVGEDYGRDLEFGTETIAPRPFMTPVFHVWERKFGREAADAEIVS